MSPISAKETVEVEVGLLELKQLAEISDYVAKRLPLGPSLSPLGSTHAASSVSQSEMC